MQTNNLEDEANELVIKFKRTFFMRFGVEPVVKYNFKLPYVGRLGIGDLAIIVDKLLNEHLYYDGTYSTIMARTRKRPIVYYRHAFCHLALELRYSCSHVGKYLNMNHSSVLHSNRLVNNLLEVKDQEMTQIVDRIKTALYEFVNSNEKNDTVLQQTE